MFKSFVNFSKLVSKNLLNVASPRLNKIFHQYSFVYIDQNDNLDQAIIENIRKSKVIIINKIKENGQNTNIEYILLSFKRTILVIEQTSTSLLQKLLSINTDAPICFLTNFDDMFTENINVQNQFIKKDENFEEEIFNFNQALIFIQRSGPKTNQIWGIIQSSISGYLIKESYILHKFTYLNEQNSKIEEKIYDKDEFVELRMIGIGSVFVVYLNYHIEQGKLFAVKKPNVYSDEIAKLVNREIENYKQINYLFLPKFYGKIKDTDSFVIDFINGSTLENINKFNFGYKEKLTIIFEIIMVINYFHKNNLIYRDLKHNNIIIAENGFAYVIDFDRMIKIKNDIDDDYHTLDFASVFIAPEVLQGKKSFANDIYSLGQLIYFIFEGIIPDNSKKIEFISLKTNFVMQKLYKMCTENEIEKRPSISEFMYLFYSQVGLWITEPIIQNDPDVIYFKCLTKYQSEYILKDVNKAIHYYSLNSDLGFLLDQFELGVFYHFGMYVERDINKAIKYYTLAANHDHQQALYNLGVIYHNGEYIERDINKAIKYYTLAAEKNYVLAQYNLGVIYHNGEYIERDINKAIKYYTLAAEKNYVLAQYNLGIIYHKGKYVEQDISKAIQYYTLAANQNHSPSQYNLGVIYEKSQYNMQNINKAIQYYTLAANQNHSLAQCNLGFIYYEGKEITRNISKAVHYFELSANQGHSDSLLMLGLIYENSYFKMQDINKSIQYYTRAADQNNIAAQYNLGLTYEEGKLVPRDINKSIHYYTLAANNNVYMAQFKLGMIYGNGEYIERNYNKAIHYFTLASKHNDVKSLFNLGSLYENKKYDTFDIDKSIHYYTLAAKQNFALAQYCLGNIYYSGIYVTRNIDKSIYYFTLAANQNHLPSINNLGCIYECGKFVKADINKAIYYYSLAANQNYPVSQNNLGSIYENRKYDMNKAFHYYQLSADQKYSLAQMNLGNFYYKYLKNNDKAIHYLTLASNQNNSDAQYLLGIIYSDNSCSVKDMRKAISFFSLSSYNRCIRAHFPVGYFYHEGKNIKRDIKQSIHYYKEASSFNNQYAKNNLGIIYKNGFGDEIKPNIGLSMSYFEEAIRQKNDMIAKYNYSHLLIYDIQNKEKLKVAIELLISLFDQNFQPAKELLCIALIKYYGSSLENIREQNLPNNILLTINQMIKGLNLYNEPIFVEKYKQYKYIDFVYDFKYKFKLSSSLKEEDNKENDTRYNITSHFYDGFKF